MYIDKLLLVGSGATVSDAPPAFDAPQPRVRELHQMLSKKNGFYAFESALHVFQWIAENSRSENIGLHSWNQPDLWRHEYEGVTKGLTFFAEDAFGAQFAIRDEEVVTFDPESGDIKPAARTLEEWAKNVLENYYQLTGFPVAHAWQLKHGAIPKGKRLLPKVPFLLGGEFAVENLVAVSAVEAMRYRGDLWRQLRDLPDGAKVKLKVLPK